jgi:hypothetical protein
VADDDLKRQSPAAETPQKTVRFSYAELDRRIRTLEGTVADLESRVERLETSGPS